MSRITFIQADGEAQEIQAEVGTSAMRAALMGGVRGINADCGGEISCATCHVYVSEAWTAKVGEPGLDEDDMLEFTTCERKTNSRLSCQIEIDEELDGLELTIPEEQ